MANIDNPSGLSLVKHKLGAPLSATVNPYYVPAAYGTALFVGDPVLKTGTANAAAVALGAEDYGIGMLPVVSVAAAGGKVSGVMVGKRANVNDLVKMHNPASTEAVVYVCDDPYVVFRIKEDSVGGALAITSVGLNADIALDVAGNATTGMSGAELDSSSAAAGADVQLKILRLSDCRSSNGVRNVLGADAKWDVTINEHTEATNIAGV